MHRLRTIFASLAVLASFASGAADVYPDKPVHYYIGFAAGGESDIAARFQQLAFRKKYSHEMIIEYKPGAGGGLAWAQLNGMPADGYTIMGVNLPTIVLQPMEGEVQYKTDDIVPVYWFHYTPDALVVANDSPYKTFRDFVNAAKQKPGQLSLAGSGTNSANHLAHEKLDVLAGIKTIYAPFKGTGDLTSSVIGQHVTGAMSSITFAIQLRGKVRALAVATEKRHPQLPDVPTFKELGFNWVGGAYRGVAVPKSTPPALRKQVSDMIAAINKDPELRKQMEDGGFEVVDVSLDKMPAFMQEQSKEYIEMARRMGLLK
ncbi:MAG TPA: tripartite tricarboxylate transporter substrate binding protein [Burkholderiales bacterium]|nr:tripartite tricarboxylate transporter substrate binding protein [Burkholderiales bacterium]